MTERNDEHDNPPATGSPGSRRASGTNNSLPGLPDDSHPLQPAADQKGDGLKKTLIYLLDCQKYLVPERETNKDGSRSVIVDNPSFYVPRAYEVSEFQLKVAIALRLPHTFLFENSGILKEKAP